MFVRSRNPIVPFILTYNFDLSKSWPFKITFWTQAGQSPANKVLSRHGLPASLGELGLENLLEKLAKKLCTRHKKDNTQEVSSTSHSKLERRDHMCPGVMTDLQQINDARKTAVIDRELSRLNVDIACLQETRPWPTMVQSEKPTTPSFGKESLWMNQGNMVSVLL